jgi:hypothetical protein
MILRDLPYGPHPNPPPEYQGREQFRSARCEERGYGLCFGGFSHGWTLKGLKHVAQSPSAVIPIEPEAPD